MLCRLAASGRQQYGYRFRVGQRDRTLRVGQFDSVRLVRHDGLFWLGDELSRIQGDRGELSPSNGQSEWRESYREQSRSSSRIEIVAAE
jgi:hypothetical protein